MMTLVIDREQLLQRTPLNGNIDNDKIVPHIITSQDIELQTVLGTPLYERILEDVKDETLAGEYLKIYNAFIVPMVAHYTAANFYLFHAFEVGNGGIYRHQSENSFTPDMADIRKLSEEQRNKAGHYRTRLNDYLCFYSSNFPEYLQTPDAGMSPNNNNQNNQWVIR
jgi:hypothetical protein